MKIAFVGCGAAGRPLAVAWRRAGHEIGAVRARRSAAAAVRAIGAGVANGPIEGADVVVFATPDDALAAAAKAHPLTKPQVALHLSGALPSTVLDATGAATASLHPLRAFADLETALAALPKTYFFCEGRAVETAERLARDAGGTPVRLRTENKTLYHAGAAIASNYTVTLFACAKELFALAGIDEAVAQSALLQLVRGSLDNVEAVGIPKGLTGPAARGDVEVIRGHLAALEEPSRALYRTLLAATLPLARAKGTLSEDSERALRGLLG